MRRVGTILDYSDRLKHHVKDLSCPGFGESIAITTILSTLSHPEMRHHYLDMSE
jgi:hypothetical protein